MAIGYTPIDNHCQIVFYIAFEHPSATLYMESLRKMLVFISKHVIKALTFLPIYDKFNTSLVSVRKQGETPVVSPCSTHQVWEH